MTSHDSDIAARIAVIGQEYLARLQKEGLPNLRTLRQRFLETPCDDSLRNQLLHAAHDMSGSGAVFGYDEVSNGGHRLEDAVRALIKHTIEDSADHRNRILALIDQLDAICVTATRDLKPTDNGARS